MFYTDWQEYRKITRRFSSSSGLTAQRGCNRRSANHRDGTSHQRKAINSSSIRKKEIVLFFVPLLPISSAGITLPSAASCGEAAGQSGPKSRAPLMAFIKAALWKRLVPAHRARRSRTPAQLAGVKHRSVRPAALALILAASSAAPHPARLPADRCCLCISSADHFPGRGEGLWMQNYIFPISDLG